MKKIAILTSLLALAACGGGSGGGFVPSEVGRVGTVSADAAKSNAVITNMVSEIGVLEDGGADAPSVNIGRAASGSFIHNNQKYNSYKLDDAELEFGDHNWGVAHFHVDEKGKIDKLVFEDLEDKDNDVIRQGDSDKFIVRFNDDDLDDGKRDVKFSYTSYAKDLGLTYVDFGMFTGTSPFSGEQVALPFVAGYEVKQIQNPTGEMKFSGLAKGSVARHDGNDDNGHDLYQETITAKGATLVFNNGTETLNANFDKWYNTTITKNQNGTYDLEFVDTGNVKEVHRLAETTVKNADQDIMTTKYYGNAADTKEAVALIYYQEDTNDGNVNVSFGFAGKEQK